MFTNEIYQKRLYRFNETKPVTCQPTAGIIAVSVNKLADLDQSQKGCANWLQQYQPMEKIGYSIFIYNITDEKLVEQQEFCTVRCSKSCTESNETFRDYIYKEKCMCICA